MNMKRIVFIFFFGLLLSVSVRSQSWRTNADSLIVNHVAADLVGHADIFVFPELLTSEDTIILSDGSVVQVPYTNCYGYFIDIHPLANWSHACKYCFVDSSLDYVTVSANMPPSTNNLF